MCVVPNTPKHCPNDFPQASLKYVGQPQLEATDFCISGEPVPLANGSAVHILRMTEYCIQTADRAVDPSIKTSGSQMRPDREADP